LFEIWIVVTFAGYWIVPKINMLLKKKHVPITSVVTLTDVITHVLHRFIH